MEDKAKIFLLFLLEELTPGLGINFCKENGENINFEVLQEILENKKIVDEFYQILEDKLLILLEKYPN